MKSHAVLSYAILFMKAFEIYFSLEVDLESWKEQKKSRRVAR